MVGKVNTSMAGVLRAMEKVTDREIKGKKASGEILDDVVWTRVCEGSWEYSRMKPVFDDPSIVFAAKYKSKSKTDPFDTISIPVHKLPEPYFTGGYEQSIWAKPVFKDESIFKARILSEQEADKQVRKYRALVSDFALKNAQRKIRMTRLTARHEEDQESLKLQKKWLDEKDAKIKELTENLELMKGRKFQDIGSW